MTDAHSAIPTPAAADVEADVALAPVPEAPASTPSAEPEQTGRFAFLVAAGILASRIAGVVRQSVFAYYMGASLAADAFQAAFRIPNFLQNLFGEGVLSASFIPEYAGLRARQLHDDAREVAGAVFTALVLVTSAIVLLGIWGAPWLVDVLAGGFEQDTKASLTALLVRILFPGAALLVFSAWCLGILNSHRKFFLSYAAPLAWNAIMVGALLIFGAHRTPVQLAVILAWASVVGSAAQFAVQLPAVMRAAGRIRPHLRLAVPGAVRVYRNFWPAFVARGVVQISAFIDLTLATYLPSGAVSAMFYAQTLYLLPGSLFGMSVSAAELPAMSSVLGNAEEVAAKLRARVNRGMERIAYFVVPCMAVFVGLGDLVIGALFQRGRFTPADTLWVWMILCGSTIGLLASTLGRLSASAFYALRDTRTPLRYALVRIALTTALGVVSAFYLPGWLGLDARWGAAGLTASAGVAGWVEFLLLRRGLAERIGKTGISARYAATLWGAAILAIAVASLWRLVVPSGWHIPAVALTGATAGLVYLLATVRLGVPEAAGIAANLRKILRVS